MSEGFAAIWILARTHMHRLPAIEIITPKYHWFELPPPSHMFVRGRLAAWHLVSTDTEAPRRWCWCQTAPYTRRRESWLLTKYSFSLVREPAAAQLPTHGLGLLSCLPPALTLAESDTVAKPTALS